MQSFVKRKYFMKKTSVPSTLRIVMFYAVLGAFWIAASDHLLEMIVTDVHTMSKLQTYKGWAFVFASSLLIYFLVQRELRTRERTEKNLRESEEKYRALIETASEALRVAHMGHWEFDVKIGLFTFNDQYYSLHGMTASQVGGYRMTAEEFSRRYVHPEDAPLVGAAIRRAVETTDPDFEYQVEARILRADGAVRWVTVWFRIEKDDNGRTSKLFGVNQDITERKQGEEALFASEGRYRNLFEDSPVSLWEEDISEVQAHIAELRYAGIRDFNRYFSTHSEEVYTCIGMVKVISVNKATLKIYEAPDQATLQQDLSRVFTAQSFDAFRGIMVALSEGRKIYECETVNRTFMGRSLNVLLRWSLLAGDGGRQSRALISIIDISERKIAEDKILQSEAFIRNILDTVDEGFLVVDHDYRILTANKAYCSQLARNCDDVIGKHCYEMSHRANRPCFEEGEECAVRQVFATGEPQAALHKHTDHDGNILYVETKGFPVKDTSGNVTSVIETIHNITEKRLLEEERLKTQKLESIGTLAGGIAHDFNNLLQGIFGYISMAKRNVDHKDKALAMLEQAENALQQSVNLTSQLLTFARGGKPVKKLINLRLVIENSTKFTLSGSHSDFRMDIPEDLWQTEADQGQVGQVIQNIVLNADQAMPLSGSVIVTATNMAEGDTSFPPGLARGNYVMISIQDAGVGIPEQYIGKIFDPYFTTKEKGSGLGLATCYSIIRNHGGMIDVRTKSGKGSTFRIYLPAIAGEGRTASAAKPAEPSLTSTVRVLVMDDEEIIRNLSKELLGALGHEVAVAKHGQEALEKYQGAMAAGKPFDIVILDLTVRGGLGGADTVKKLLEIDPAVKAIVSSGYSDDAAIANYLPYGFKAYLRKPYDINALRDILISLM
jgi:two-component system cell cycle sensor histidine kinase/response regulator CckA